MKSIMQEASSVAKAIEQAWIAAGKPQEFTVKVFEEAERNFFGLTTKTAKVAIHFADVQRQSQILIRYTKDVPILVRCIQQHQEKKNVLRIISNNLSIAIEMRKENTRRDVDRTLKPQLRNQTLQKTPLNNTLNRCVNAGHQI